jgi:hypothetical protein
MAAAGREVEQAAEHERARRLDAEHLEAVVAARGGRHDRRHLEPLQLRIGEAFYRYMD